MKCIGQNIDHKDKHMRKIVRVSDDEAARRVESGKWVYTNRTAWKEAGRQYG